MHWWDPRDFLHSFVLSRDKWTSNDDITMISGYISEINLEARAILNSLSYCSNFKLILHTCTVRIRREGININYNNQRSIKNLLMLFCLGFICKCNYFYALEIHYHARLSMTFENSQLNISFNGLVSYTETVYFLAFFNPWNFRGVYIHESIYL